MARLKVFWNDEELTSGGRIGLFAVVVAAVCLMLT